MANRLDWQFKSRVDRAFSQRIYLIDTTYLPSEENIAKKGTEAFFFEIMGNSGTAYGISFIENKKIHCTCPDHNINGNLCKHLLFVLIRVLGFSTDQVFKDYYEPAYNDSPDKFMITQITVERSIRYMEHRKTLSDTTEIGPDGKTRKEVDKTEPCPICLEDLGEEQLVWCKAQCGNSVHQSCFLKWFQKKSDASCVLCRAQWIW